MTHMKTTVELPDELLREVIARHLAAGRFTLRDASVPGEGVSAPFADATWAQLREAAYGDRL